MGDKAGRIRVGSIFGAAAPWPTSAASKAGKRRAVGPQAPMAVADSAASLRGTFARLAPEHSGHFLNHDGTALDW